MLLDTTLRDGSYEIDFQFTARDTVLIVSALEQAGIPFIEVGHGLGLNASNCGKGLAAESDEAYLEAAASALNHAQWGTFFIPGIGCKEDIRKAAQYEMKFVRIGTNITETAQSEPYVALAKELGLFVSSNFMKTYALEPMEVALLAKQAQKYGSDLVCIVDSAGGMLPEDIERYFRSIREETDIALGFHGHNNLGMAVANTVKAAELGAVIIDVSLQGIGRSAGNAPAEIVTLVLQRKGFRLSVDVEQIMDIGEKLIRPFIRRQGVNTIDIICGYAQFHSSYMETVFKYAHEYRINPRELIVRVSEEDRVHVPDKLIGRVAKELVQERCCQSGKI